MAQRGKQPRDYALLVRQTANVFEGELGEAFATAGLSLRNESRSLGRTTVQDLLVDADSGSGGWRLPAEEASGGAGCGAVCDGILTWLQRLPDKRWKL